MNVFKKYSWITFFVVGFFFSSIWSAYAATLYVTPSAPTITVGSTFSVNVRVNTEGQPVNTIEAKINFPSDKLVVTQVTAGTLFPLQAPGSLAKTPTSVYFAAGVPSPGYLGSDGLIGTITFKALADGNATLFVSSGSVFLNNGQATDALSRTAGSLVTIKNPEVKPVEPKKEKPLIQEIGAVDIISGTHLDQTRWYSNSSILVSWTNPVSAKGFSYVLDTNPYTIPNNTIETKATTKVFEDTPDGRWYFHIKAINEEGHAGPVSHYAFLIDSTPPEMVSLRQSRENQEMIMFEANDSLSGVDRYYVSHDSNQTSFEATSPYVFTHLDPGEYTVVVTAFDKAGNKATSQMTITIMNRVGFILGSLFANTSFVYIFIFSILLLLVGVCTLLIVVIRKHHHSSQSVSREVESLKHDIDNELVHLRQHIYKDIDTLMKNESLTASDTKKIRTKLLRSIRNIDNEK